MKWGKFMHNVVGYKIGKDFFFANGLSLRQGKQLRKYDIMGQEKESNKLCKTLYWFGYYGEKNVLMKFGNLKDIGDG